MSDEPDNKKEDEKKNLTSEQKNQVSKWLLDKGGNPARPCSVCGTAQWIIGDRIVAPLNIEGAGVVLGGGEIYPSVPVICSHCGNTHFINAVMMGLLPSDGKK